MDDFHKVLGRLGTADDVSKIAVNMTRDNTKLTMRTMDTNMNSIPAAPSAYPPASPSREAHCGSPRKEAYEVRMLFYSINH